MDPIISYDIENDIIIVNLKGTFQGNDNIITDNFRNEIKEYLRKGYLKFMLNFKEVSFLSSTMIGVLTSAHYNVVNAQGRIVPYGLASYIKNMMFVVGLDKLFPIFDTKEEAEEYLNKKVKHIENKQ